MQLSNQPGLTQAVADSRYPHRVGGPQTYVPICAGKSTANESGASTGITEGCMTVTYTPTINGQGLCCEFWNWGAIGSTPQAGWGEGISAYGTISALQCGVWVGGNFYAMQALGAQSVALAPGGMVQFVIPDFNVVAGTAIKIQWGWNMASGNFPRWNTNYYNTAIDSITNASGASNVGNSQAPGGSGSAFGPVMVGTIPDNTPQIAVLEWGDSIGYGLNDDPSTFNVSGYNYQGWMSRGLQAIGLPSRRVCLSSEQSAFQLFPDSIRRRQALNGLTHAIFALNTNDIGAGTAIATIQANTIQLATELVNRGIKVGIATLFPRADGALSTTFWGQTNAQAAANQTVHTSSANWDTYNAWALSMPAPFSFVVDPHSQVAEAGSSQTWGNGGRLVQGCIALTGGTTTSVAGTGLAAAYPLSGNFQKMTINWTKLNGIAPITADDWRQVYNGGVSYSGGSGTLHWGTTNPTGATNNGALSVAPVAGDTFDIWESWTYDGIHPNTWGYIQAANAIQLGMFMP